MILVTMGVIGIGIFAGVVAVVGYVMGVAATAPSIDSLKPIDKGATSIVYAAGGQRLGFIQSDELRTPVGSPKIPDALKQATVAIEDQRFYKHKGIDYEGIVRAAIKNLKSGKTVQGGSTITMQLVRNLYISKERTFRRKIREAKLAQELESEHPGPSGKDWILTHYLNSVAYGTVGGQTAVGVQAASHLFFDKPVSRINLAEAALLAGMPQAPSVYNPFLRPQNALERRSEVLARMVKLKMITPAQGRAAQGAPLGVRPNTYYTARREAYFFDYVKQELIDRYGLNTVREGGLRIHTTIELPLQKAARAAIAHQLPYSSDPSASIVTIDPSNGYIKAMASSGSYGKNKFNYAAQGHRQAGSTFKVMVLMTALRNGVNPDSTTYDSHPLDLHTPWGPWKVQTYSHSYGGRMNLVQATLKSDNTVYAQLDLDMGPREVRKTAYDMGIKTHLDAYPAEGLGGLRLGVSPLEMADAYATIASGGYRNEPIAITKVTFPDGKSEDLGKPKRQKIFSDAVTYEATKILEQNVQQGTGTGANIGCPAAGKTGTVDDFTDAWFIGFTPKLTTSVWMGYPNSKVPMTNVHGIQVAGGTIPASIWHDYMSVAHGSDCSDFPRPSEPFQSAPFFGRYAQTGTSSDRNYGYRGGYGRGYGTGGGTNYRNGTGGGTTGGGRYNPQYYESPPQPAPGAPAPQQPTTPPRRGGGVQAPGHGGAPPGQVRHGRSGSGPPAR